MPPTPSPTYERLRDTIAKRMRMSRIDQPLMLMELLGRRSQAPAQDVARRIRRAWWARFTFNGITRCEKGTYALVGGDEQSDPERDELLQLCRHRMPISGSIKDRVHRCARGRCGCAAGPMSTRGPWRWTHRAQEPRRHRRPQQPAGPRLPLQCRQARRLFADARGRIDFRCLQASYALREAGCVFFWLEAAARC